MYNIDLTNDFTEEELIKDHMFTELILVSKCGVIGHNKYDIQQDCSVCFDSLYETAVLELTCGHLFHQECLLSGVSTYGYRMCLECKNPIQPITNNIFDGLEPNCIIKNPNGPKNDLFDVPLNQISLI